LIAGFELRTLLEEKILHMETMRTAIRLLVSMAFLSAPAFSATYFVGQARQYKTLQQVASLLSAGDSVLVDGSQTYPGGVVFRSTGSVEKRIVILGVRIGGLRPIISGGSDGVTFFTPDPYTGPGADHYTFQGFEVSGERSRPARRGRPQLSPWNTRR
jgi:hypothetical protein